MMVARAKVSHVAAVQNVASRISKGPEATSDRCSTNEINRSCALIVMYSM